MKNSSHCWVILWYLYLSYLTCHPVSVTEGVCLCLQHSHPESALGHHHFQVIIIQKYLSYRCQKSGWDYYIIQIDNPVYSVVKKWGEVCFSNFVDGWTQWEGTARGGWWCRVSLRDEVASTLLNWAVLTHKKGWEAQPIIDQTFWIFLSFFSPFFMAAPNWSVPLKETARLLGNCLNCPAFATVTATVEPPWGWWWAGPCWLQPATHLWTRAVFKLGKWL